MKRTNITLLIIMLVLFLSACGEGGLFAPTPTSTATPTYTRVPTATFTPEPTATSIPTPTPTKKPLAVLGGEQVVRAGAFSFKLVLGMQYEIDGENAIIGDEEGNIFIFMTGIPISALEVVNPDEFLDGFLERFGGGIENLETSDHYPYFVAGVEGIAVDLSGRLFGDDVTGRVVVAFFSESRVFTAAGFAIDDPNGKRWEAEGEQIFDTIVGTVVYLEDLEGAETCQISDDPTYGYTKDNPIRVGGDAYGGPARERAYLETLLGPDGETISYFRQGSIGHGGTFLDIYEVTYDGLSQPVILYIDEYSFEDLLAPVGFTCIGQFPLYEP